MSFEDIKAEISLLLTEMENQPEDLHQLHEQIREKLNEMRAFGMPIPQDLLDLERKIEKGFETGGS